MRTLTVGIIVSILIFALMSVFAIGFVSNQINSTSKVAQKAGATDEETSNPTNLATNVKTQTDLKNIQTGLAVYFAEFGYYPIDLEELVSSGSLVEMDLTGFTYLRCDADTVVVKTGSGGFKLDNGSTGSDLTC